jgi:hypothetical protein
MTVYQDLFTNTYVHTKGKSVVKCVLTTAVTAVAEKNVKENLKSIS